MILGLGCALGMPRNSTAGGSPPVSAPALTSSDYNLFDNSGGDLITLTGTDLGSATVDVGGTAPTVIANTSTTVTFTTPAIAAGSKSVTVTTAGGTSNALSIEAYDVDANAFGGWWRASFGGSPWTPTASAGTSGSTGNLTEATNPPAVGSAVNGRTPADFDGTNDILVTANNLTSYVTAADGTILVYASIDTVAAFNATVYANPALVSRNGGGNLGMVVASNGLHAYYFDGTTFCQPTATAFTTGHYHLFAMRWTGSVLSQSVDAGAETTVALAGSANIAAAANVGRAYTSSAGLFTDGKFLEVIMAKTALSTTDIDKINRALKCRYAQ